MIDSKELRIGNLIYQQTLKVIPANFINKEVVIVGYIDDELFPNDITNQFIGIPLTEEWLLRFGFEKYDWTDSFFKKVNDRHLMIQFYRDDILIYFTKVSKDSKGHKMNGRDYFVCKNSITTIHKIQNLYFSLTGEELILNK